MLFRRAIFAVIAAVLIIATSPISARSAVDETTNAQVPGVYSFRLGEFTITALSDGTLPQDLDEVLTNANPAEVEQLLHQNFLENPVEGSINAFLVNTGDQQILVDTGSGQLFGPGLAGKLQLSLEAAGYTPDEIDMILLTHIHTDHSGGLVEDEQLMFPYATVYVGKPDVDFWFDPANAERLNIDGKYFDEAIQTVKPYLDAGKLEMFSGETTILPGITALPTPGHTPGHSFYVVESEGERIEFCGDILHFASIQLANPEISVVYDVDANIATEQRVRQFARLEASRRLIATAHLPFPGVGHIRADDQGYTWVPIDYRWRD